MPTPTTPAAVQPQKPKVKSQRLHDLAQIHKAKKALGLDDASYRAALASATQLVDAASGRVVVEGVTSAADADHEARQKILAYFRRHGWADGYKVRATKVAEHKSALIGKVRALLLSMGLTDTYGDSLASGMYKTDKYDWLHSKQLIGVITALSKRQQKLRSSPSPSGRGSSGKCGGEGGVDLP